MNMRRFFFLSSVLLGAVSVMASDSALVKLYQPLDGQASAEVMIMPVAGHVNYGTSGFPFELALVVAKNIPPTDSPQPLDDHNIASLAGIKVKIDEDEKGRYVIELDLTGLKVDENFICTAPEIVGATLECMRLTAGTRLNKMVLKPILKPSGQEDLAKIVAAFQKHPKTKPFPWRKDPQN